MSTVPKTPITVLDGSNETEAAIGSSPFTIGRAPDRDLVLANQLISRKHAEIVFEDGAFFVVDVGSRHGTFVNGIKVDRHRLDTNDAIQFGSVDGPVLRFDSRSVGAPVLPGDSFIKGENTSAVFVGLLRPGDATLRYADGEVSVADSSSKGRTIQRYDIPGRLGPYEILRELGRGGSAIVCLARNEFSASGRQVALRLPLFEQDKRRIAHEAKLWRLLSDRAHPNILNLEDLNKVGDAIFFVMEYMEGGSLDAALQGVVGTRRVEIVLEALPGIVKGLAFAHSQSVVHGDIKPQNILLSSDRKDIKIGDFGLSRAAESFPESEDVAEVAGTFSFMAPESFAGLRNYQTDIYAFGATLYYLLSGKYPFHRREGNAGLVEERTTFNPDLSGIVGVPPWLASTIKRCMDPLPDNRFRDASELRDYVVPLVEPRKARQIILTAWCNPESESVDYDLEISGERSREMLNVEVTYQTVAGLASEFDRIGHLVVERVGTQADGEDCSEIDREITRRLKNVAEDGAHFVLGSRVRKMLMAERASALLAFI